MAVIDTFLKLVITQRAQSLRLHPDEVPRVVTEGASSELPMPSVPPDLIDRLSAEVAGAERAAQRTAEPLEGTYQTADGEEFTYRISGAGTDCTIEMHALAPATEPETEGIPSSTPAPPPLSFSSTGSPDPLVLQVIQQALHSEASDIFLSTGKPSQMRLHGSIRLLNETPMRDEDILNLIPTEEGVADLELTGSTDFAVRWPIGSNQQRFRLNVFKHSHGLAAAIRPIRTDIPTLNSLHLPPNLTELCSYASGLVLVTGASGSGKSTTLAALVDYLNQTKPRHIITIEDPIEFEHHDAKSLVHQREVGASVESFSSGLRSALRENPDVILLGEMRDLATISAALTAAETGHLVLSTLHTGSATSAINRIVDVFPGHQQPHVRVQLAASLRAVLSQRLVPSADGRSRYPALEKLLVTPAVANSIRDGQEHHMRSAMQTGASEGMITLERSLATLECRGHITREAALRYAQDQEALKKLLE